jgi:hypothetical protein
MGSGFLFGEELSGARGEAPMGKGKPTAGTREGSPHEIRGRVAEDKGKPLS